MAYSKRKSKKKLLALAYWKSLRRKAAALSTVTLDPKDPDAYETVEHILYEWMNSFKDRPFKEVSITRE